MEITNDIAANSQTINQELNWLSRVIETAFHLYFGNDTPYRFIDEVTAPDMEGDNSFYATTIRKLEMGFAERLLLVLTLAPHLRPQVLDPFYIRNSNYDRGFTEFGGIKGTQHSGFIPTGETFAFILAGASVEHRIAMMELLSKKHYFARQNILKINSTASDEPLLSGALSISQEYLTLLTTGQKYQPDYNVNFPAKLITTQMEWSDLVLPQATLHEIQEVNNWIRHGNYLLHEMGLGKHIKRGYRALFYGPPGTGKTLTASLLGKSAELDVYRIDLSLIVSKYIGETEKNLSGLFDLAENKNWILFFDEADSLFGKRSNTKDAHDRYANQEVSYLLQRIEDFPGVIILASNLKGNIDEAFLRRFQSVIYFPNPGVPEKIRLWQSIFNNKFTLDESVDFEDLAHQYNLTGGTLINVLRYCALKSSSRNEQVITLQDIKEGVSKELRKEGKNAG